MSTLHVNPTWRTNKDSDWNIKLTEGEKSPIGFVGIKNLESTGYLSSLF